MEESYTDESEEEHIEKALGELKIQKHQKQPQKTTTKSVRFQNEPQRPVARHPQYQNQTNFVPQTYSQTSNRQNVWGRPRINDPYTRKPTMRLENSGRHRKRGGSKLRFRSHYGAGGEHLDTRTKSSMLLSYCFGWQLWFGECSEALHLGPKSQRSHREFFTVSILFFMQRLFVPSGAPEKNSVMGKCLSCQSTSFESSKTTVTATFCRPRTVFIFICADVAASSCGGSRMGDGVSFRVFINDDFLFIIEISVRSLFVFLKNCTRGAVSGWAWASFHYFIPFP